MGKLPIVGGVAKGLNEVISRPGDLVNDPGKFLSSAAQGALPFFAGPLAGAVGGAGALPGWAGPAMSFLGGKGGQQQQGQPHLGFATGPNWNQLAGQIGSGINLFTDPSGIKLFGGSNYPDNGLGDKALGYADKLGQTGQQFLNAGIPQKLLDNANAFANQGQSFLAQGNQGFPILSNMGELGNMRNIINQISDTAGIQNPYTGQGGGNDPYALHPHEQEQFNTAANMVNQGRQSAISNLRQQLAAKGISDPRAIAAAEASINAAHNGMLQQTHGQLASQSFGNRQQAQSQLAQIFPQLYGAQNASQQQAYGNAAQFLGQGGQGYGSALNAGANLMNLPVNAYQNAAQQAINNNRYSRELIGSELSHLFPPGATGQLGNLIPGNGQQGQPWIQPGQPGFDAGAGNVGGVGPMPEPGAGFDWTQYNPWATESTAPDYQAWMPQAQDYPSPEDYLSMFNSPYGGWDQLGA